MAFMLAKLLEILQINILEVLVPFITDIQPQQDITSILKK